MFHEPVYISSKVFGKTFPFDVDFEAPTAVVTDSIVDYRGASRQQDHKRMLGCRCQHSLSDGRETLDPVQSPKAQNIAEKSLFWLQVVITPFAAGESVDHESIGATFRRRANETNRSTNATLLE